MRGSVHGRELQGLQGMKGRSRPEKRLENQQTFTKMIYYGGTKV